MRFFTTLAVFATFCVSQSLTAQSDPALVGFAKEANPNPHNNNHEPTDHGNAEHRVASTRNKRSVFHLYDMMKCTTTCNPLSYKGYGCYCGFLGSGLVVDGIDECCKNHDSCYEETNCKGIDHYFTPYKWKCNGGRPYCVKPKGPAKALNRCGHQLCECDREFAQCLRRYPCPRTKMMCMTSPWRYWQNVFMGMSSGMGTHHRHHPNASV